MKPVIDQAQSLIKKASLRGGFFMYCGQGLRFIINAADAG
jgi:hypothetical protein